MGKIQVLEKNVSDKIAAGEVVERPASVIKELLENSVDAGAKVIAVEIKNGGISYMRVTDNGVGMSKEDVKLCVLRHATSKIKTEDDLSKISTLGFRGEALSSISAVSRLEIYTKTKDDDAGTHLISHNGEIVDIAEAGCPDGTTVVVRDLFSTVPARMKFLKKDYTEAGYIEDIISRLALSHPEISVKFINNGKEVIFTPGDNMLSSAIFAVYGKDIKNAMIEANYDERGVSVFGMIGKGTASRPNRNMESFFVNGRYIKSPLLSRAAEEAYKNELMVGKFPTLVLNITLPPEDVDINVHPTKLEAKFADEKHIYHCVYWAVKNALYSSEFIPKVSENKSIKPQFVKKEVLVKEITKEAPKPVVEVKKPQISVSFREIDERPKVRTEEKVVEKPVIEKTIVEKPAVEKLVIEKPTIESFIPEFKKEEAVIPKEVVLEAVIEETKIPEYKICGQVFATYIIVEKDGKMLMVDQHAAHERLRYEKLLKEYQKREVSTQLLLCPENVSLTSTEFGVFCENKDAIYDLGFLAEEFGERQIVVRGVPQNAADCDVSATILEIIGMLSSNHKNIDDDLASKMLYRIACRGAVKANAVLTNSEMKTLLDEIFMLNGINTCPHGRPITIEFTKDFIEKQFKRIV